MADLPTWRAPAANKPFEFCSVDYCGPFFFRQARSECKAWGLLFTCLYTRCIHVELVTSLDLTSFLLAFPRFTNLRGPVDTFLSDNGATFCAVAEQLPSLLESKDFHCSHRKWNINWVKIPLMPPVRVGAGKVWLSYLKAP